MICYNCGNTLAKYRLISVSNGNKSTSRPEEKKPGILPVVNHFMDKQATYLTPEKIIYFYR